MEVPPPPRVLFLCTGNSCRSQMAEGLLRHLTSGRIEAVSAGTAPSRVHPRAIAAMAELGIDIGGQRSKSVAEFLGQPVDLVIAVCSSAAEACPPFPGRVPVLRWPFEDPAQASGSEEETAAVFRRVRDRIRSRLEEWIADGLPPLDRG